MTNLDSTRIVNGTTQVATEALSLEDERLDLRLQEIWRSHHERDLSVRWQTGALLNERLGKPTGRLAHGKAVLKRVAEKLQIAESDLSRMRWFAFLFPSAEDVQAKSPGVRSWTKVKELLPQWIATAQRRKGKPSPADGSGKQSPGKAKDKALVGGILRHLSSVTKQLRKGAVHLDEAAQERLFKSIQQMAEAIFDRVRFRVTVEKV